MNEFKMSKWVIPGLKRQYCPTTFKSTRPIEIIEVVCDYFGLSKDDVLEKGRKRDIVYARNIIIYLICIKTDLSLKKIAELMSPATSDHTTIIHSRDKIRTQLSLKLPIGVISPTQLDLNKIENLLSN